MNPNQLLKYNLFHTQSNTGRKVVTDWAADNNVDQWTGEEKYQLLFGLDANNNIAPALPVINSTINGCFSCALYACENLTPVGKLTQALIDDFKRRLDELIG